MLLLLLLLSHFSRVRLCATPQTAAHQAPPSLGFSRQEHWSGLPLPSPIPNVTHTLTPLLNNTILRMLFLHQLPLCSPNLCMHANTLQSCLTLCNPMDCSPQEYWSGLPCPTPGNLSGQGLNLLLLQLLHCRWILYQ